MRTAFDPRTLKRMLYGEKKLWAKVRTVDETNYSAFDYLSKRIQPEASYSFLSALGTSMLAGLNMADSVSATSLHKPDFSKALAGDLFFEYYTLPDSVRNQLINTIPQLEGLIPQDLLQELWNAIWGPLSQFASIFEQIADALRQVNKYLYEIIEAILSLRNLYNEIYQDLMQLIMMLLKYLFAKNFSSTNLQKGHYGKSELCRFYYDPLDLINLIMNQSVLDMVSRSADAVLQELKFYTFNTNFALPFDRNTSSQAILDLSNEYMVWDVGRWDDSYWLGNAIPQEVGYYGTAVLDVSTFDDSPPPAVEDQPANYYIVPQVPWQPVIAEADAPYIRVMMWNPECFKVIPAYIIFEDISDVMWIMKWDESNWDMAMWGADFETQSDAWAINEWYEVPHIEILHDIYNTYFRLSLLNQGWMWATTIPPETLGYSSSQPTVKLWAESMTHIALLRQKVESLLDQKGITSPYQREQYVNIAKEYYRALSGSRNKLDSFVSTPGIDSLEDKLKVKYVSLGLDPSVVEEVLTAVKDVVSALASAKYRDSSAAKKYKEFLRKMIYGI